MLCELVSTQIILWPAGSYFKSKSSRALAIVTPQLDLVANNFTQYQLHPTDRCFDLVSVLSIIFKAGMLKTLAIYAPSPKDVSKRKYLRCDGTDHKAFGRSGLKSEKSDHASVPASCAR